MICEGEGEERRRYGRGKMEVEKREVEKEKMEKRGSVREEGREGYPSYI